MPDVVEQAMALIEKRIEQLQPLVDEYQQLQRISEAFAQNEQAFRSLEAVKKAARANGATAAQQSHTYALPGTHTHGKRAEEVVSMLGAAEHGMTAKAIAEKLGIGTTYMYRVLPGLVAGGRIIKEGKAYYAVKA